jgi:hypothetical protein
MSMKVNIPLRETAVSSGAGAGARALRAAAGPAR